MTQEPWFKEWFDTEYYHILYRNRDEAEAKEFLSAVTNILALAPKALVADIACGKGRHSRVLASMGFSVLGFDLSENSIAYAAAQNTPNATFFVHDIRKPYAHKNLDAAFNLFTSFGYFDNPEDDITSIVNVFDMLKPGGCFVQDYLNGAAFVSCMPASGETIAENIVFRYQKNWVAPFIIKDITVLDGPDQHLYREKVKVYTADELIALHHAAGFRNIRLYGDYKLSTFIPESSPRLILISEKPGD